MTIHDKRYYLLWYKHPEDTRMRIGTLTAHDKWALSLDYFEKHNIGVFVEEHDEWPEARTWNNVSVRYFWNPETEKVERRTFKDQMRMEEKNMEMLLIELWAIEAELEECKKDLNNPEIKKDDERYAALLDVIKKKENDINNIHTALKYITERNQAGQEEIK